MPRDFHRRAMATAALAGLATAGGWVAVGPSADAATGCAAASNDFNADGAIDQAAGVPGRADDAGAVEVRMSGDTPDATVLRAPKPKAGDRFGASVAEVGVAGSGGACSLLVVGAPGRDVAGLKDAGAAFIYQWSDADGFSLAEEIDQTSFGVPGKPHAGAHFGAALAAPYHRASDSPTPLYAGIPGAPVSGAAAAGAFVRLRFGGTPLAVTASAYVTQDTAGVPGAAEAGDRFGARMAVLGNGSDWEVAAGAPREDIGSAKNAGGVVLWKGTGRAASVFLDQNTAGMPGTAEAGDHFGAALYSAIEDTSDDNGSFDLLIGVPAEDIGAVHDAGSVAEVNLNGAEIHAYGHNQSAADIAGTPEAGDRFGSSFATIGSVYPTGGDYLVGVPGEDIGDVADAGMVETLEAGHAWTEAGKGVPGKLEAGDRFGQVLGNAAVPPLVDGLIPWRDAVTIGVPGEDDGAGAVIAGLPGGKNPPQEWKQQHPHAGDGYGSALGRKN